MFQALGQGFQIFVTVKQKMTKMEMGTWVQTIYYYKYIFLGKERGKGGRERE